MLASILTWLVMFAAPVDVRLQIGEQRFAVFWMRDTISIFLAINACFSGVITIIKRDHLSKRYLSLSIIGIILSGAFLLLVGLFWLAFQDS